MKKQKIWDFWKKIPEAVTSGKKRYCDQIIFGNDPVSRLGVDGEGSASVEGQIGLGKDDGV